MSEEIEKKSKDKSTQEVTKKAVHIYKCEILFSMFIKCVK